MLIRWGQIVRVDDVKLWCGAKKTMRRSIKRKSKRKARTALLGEQREMETEMEEEGR